MLRCKVHISRHGKKEGDEGKGMLYTVTLNED